MFNAYRLHEMTKTAYVYMLTNKRGGTLYVGVTSDIVGRVWGHKSGLAGGFSKRYGLNMLVSYGWKFTIPGRVRLERAGQARNDVTRHRIVQIL